MIIRLPLPARPITLTFVRHDPCVTSHSPTSQRLNGPEGDEVRLSLGSASVYLPRGLVPRH